MLHGLAVVDSYSTFGSSLLGLRSAEQLIHPFIIRPFPKLIAPLLRPRLFQDLLSLTLAISLGCGCRPATVGRPPML
jgi:hypothetical protein